VTEDDQHTLVKELRGHEGPVWMVSWVHPMFGSMLASCSHDKKVIIWKETAVGALPYVDPCAVHQRCLWLGDLPEGGLPQGLSVADGVCVRCGWDCRTCLI